MGLKPTTLYTLTSLEWEREREREREREIIYVAIVSWAVKESRATATVKPRRAKLLALLKRTNGHIISLNTIILGKIKLWIIFYVWVERVKNMND